MSSLTFVHVGATKPPPPPKDSPGFNRQTVALRRACGAQAARTVHPSAFRHGWLSPRQLHQGAQLRQGTQRLVRYGMCSLALGRASLRPACSCPQFHGCAVVFGNARLRLLGAGASCAASCASCAALRGLTPSSTNGPMHPLHTVAIAFSSLQLSADMVPNVHIINTLIHLYISEGDTSRLQGLWADLQVRGPGSPSRPYGLIPW